MAGDTPGVAAPFATLYGHGAIQHNGRSPGPIGVAPCPCFQGSNWEVCCFFTVMHTFVASSLAVGRQVRCGNSVCSGGCEVRVPAREDARCGCRLRQC